MNTSNSSAARREALGLGLYLAVILSTAGCGGTGSRDNSNANGSANANGNGNANDNSGGSANQNTNDNSNGGGLAVSISSESSGPFEVGQSVQFSADVQNGTGEAAFFWTLDNPGVARLENDDSQTATVVFEATGNVRLSVEVTGGGSTSGSDSIQLTVAGDAEPPPGAVIRALDQCAQPGDPVSLVAVIEGPTPQGLTWGPDPANPIEPVDFFDLGNGTASFTAPVLLGFTYTLDFHLNATYSNGGMLSATATVTIVGGGEACF